MAHNNLGSVLSDHGVRQSLEQGVGLRGLVSLLAR
jgi:hypothetical protein